VTYEAGWETLWGETTLRPKSVWENNTEIGIGIGCEGVNWIEVAQDRMNCGLL